MLYRCSFAGCETACTFKRGINLHEVNTHGTRASTAAAEPPSAPTTSALPATKKQSTGSEGLPSVQQASTSKEIISTSRSINSNQAVAAAPESKQASSSKQDAVATSGEQCKPKSTALAPMSTTASAVYDPVRVLAPRPFVFLPTAARLYPAPLSTRKHWTMAEAVVGGGRYAQPPAPPATAFIPIGEAKAMGVFGPHPDMDPLVRVGQKSTKITAKRQKAKQK